MVQPARIGVPQILAAARTLLEEEGLEALTMRELARRLGVRAPSLYFHVESRDDLLRELIKVAMAGLGEVLAAAAALPGPPPARLHAMCDAYVSFGFQNPQLFALLFGPCPEERMLGFGVDNPAAAPLFHTVAALVPGPEVPALAQLLWALVHGVTALALSGQFPSSDHLPSLHMGIGLILAGIARRQPAS